jgi:toxin ParE1/3/4
MSRFRYTPQAEADLDAITDYFRANNPDAGIRLLDAIAERCRFAASYPRSGRSRSNLGVGVRSVAVWPYVIFFRETLAGIDVLRVLHVARDITPELFEQ